MDKGQKGVLTKAEIELLRNTFSGEGEEQLYNVRNVFLQFPTKESKKLSDEVLTIIKKYILPEINAEVPLKTLSDLYFSLDNLKQIPPEVAYLHIQAMDKMVEYLEKRFYELVDSTTLEVGTLNRMKDKGNKTNEERFIDMIAYQSIVAYIDSSLERLQMIANSKDETPEEQQLRQDANSSK